jgi:plastocyanin
MKRPVLILAVVIVAVAGLTSYRLFARNNAAVNVDTHNHHANSAKPSAALDGPLSNATVSFGAWKTTPPLDRMGPPPGPANNAHDVIPQIAKIKAGGTVNFIISGLHQVVVYDDGKQPSDISLANQIPGIPANPPLPALPPLIDDPNGRIYRGPDPRPLFPNVLDRVEVVQFENPGEYLVICGVVPHFTSGMYGFVKVVP